MAALFIYVLIVVLGHASASSVSSNILLPAWIFNPEPVGATFTGQASISIGTTYYTLNCDYDFTNFVAQGECSSNGFTFSAISSTTIYVLPSVSLANSDGLDSLQAFPQTITINCGPVGYSNIATCTSTFLSNIEDPEDEVSADESASNAIYSTVIQIGTESSLYPVFFTSDLGNPASSTATPGGKPNYPTPSPTSGPASSAAHDTAAKVGIGLGIPLGACALALLALLLYRHGKHKERSRISQMENLARPEGFASGSDGKRLSVAGAAGQTFGRQPPVYSVEMQG